MRPILCSASAEREGALEPEHPQGGWGLTRAGQRRTDDQEADYYSLLLGLGEQPSEARPEAGGGQQEHRQQVGVHGTLSYVLGRLDLRARWGELGEDVLGSVAGLADAEDHQRHR